MENRAADVINGTKIFVTGLGFVGNATYKSPELKFKKVTVNTASGEHDRSYGAVEKLEAICKISVTNPVIYAALALQNDAVFIFSSALETTGDATGRRDVLKGTFDVIDNESKDGEVYEAELKISANYWLKEVRGIPEIEIDHKRSIVRVSGVDLLEKTRNATLG